MYSQFMMHGQKNIKPNTSLGLFRNTHALMSYDINWRCIDLTSYVYAASNGRS